MQTKKAATMREERANFRFLLIACALLLVAAIVSVVSFASLVNAGDSSSADVSAATYVSGQVSDLPNDSAVNKN